MILLYILFYRFCFTQRHIEWCIREGFITNNMSVAKN